MKKEYLCLLTSFLLSILICSNLYAGSWFEDKPQDIEMIKNDVSILNLVNALGLTKDQIQIIIQQARLAQKEQTAFSARIKRINKDYKNALTELKDILAKGLAISPENEEKVHMVEKEKHIAVTVFYQRIRSYQDKIMECLEDEQIYMIEDFQPCVIPPKDLTNPVRAGQSGSNIAEIEKLIKDLRDLPEDIFDYFSHKVIDQIITETELVFGKLNEENRIKEKERLMNIVTSARQMSDLDFSIEKQKLAKQFTKRSDNVITKLKNFSNLETEMHGGISKTGKFLLDPRIIPLLKPRLNDSFKIKLGDRIKLTQTPKAQRNQKKEVPFTDFAEKLNLSDHQKTEITKCLFEGQQELWKTLMIPRKDNINMIRSIEQVKAKGSPDQVTKKSLMEVLSLKVPQTNKTYFEVMVTLQEHMESQIKKILSDPQFQLYKGSNISLFDVKLQQ